MDDDSNQTSIVRDPAVKAAHAARIGTRGEFVRVPQLSKVLGISANSIHAQMRLGTFPMPHRRIGNVIVVKLDHYVDWFEQEAPRPIAPAKRRKPWSAPADEEDASDVGLSEGEINELLGRETARERKERVKREVLDGMRRKGFDV
jgi:predicted DNA-binding transcriptional regulator AlpA